MRLEDGSVLLKKKRYNGAIYLAGYAVECALKWAIAERKNEIFLPAALEIHDLGKLLGESGLYVDLNRDAEMVGHFGELIEDWGTRVRYRTKSPSKRDAERLYRRMEQTYQWIIAQVS